MENVICRQLARQHCSFGQQYTPNFSKDKKFKTTILDCLILGVVKTISRERLNGDILYNRFTGLS